MNQRRRRAGLPATGARPKNLLEAIEAGQRRLDALPLPGLARPATEMLEKQLESEVRKIWKDLQALGCDLLGYHTHRSDRSEPGFPDWTFVGSWVMFRELKKEKGRISAEQKIWLAKLQAIGVDADIWRPSDLASGRIARELAACAKGQR